MTADVAPMATHRARLLEGAVAEERAAIPVRGTWDVLVAGGGTAGVAAAIAAARAGAKVCVIERLGFLGGLLTAWLAEPVCTFHDPDGTPVAGGIWREMLDSLVAKGGSPGPLRASGRPPWGVNSSVTPIDAEALKAVCFQLIDDSGADLELHAQAVGPVMDGDRVAGVIVECKSGREAFLARVVVDATGDGDIAARAGAAYRSGRASDGMAMPVTLHVRMGGVHGDEIRAYVKEHPGDFHWYAFLDSGFDRAPPSPYISCSGFLAPIAAAKQRGALDLGRDAISLLPSGRSDEMLVNATRVHGIDATDNAALSGAERAARRQVASLIPFLRTLPGFGDAIVLQTGGGVHVRESRHIVGEHVLTADEVASGASFPDTIARGVHPIDIHNPHGGNSTWMALRRPFEIPYRSLLPIGLDGLLLAGRCISAEHEAAAALRITPTPFAIGEAAGAAAAMAAKADLSPGKVSVSELRGHLLARGAVL